MISRFGGARAIWLGGMLALSSSAGAQSALPDLSMEDLMKLDAGQVYSASERMQPVVEAPSAVSFITAEEIARYGYRTLAEILRSVRGLYVTGDRNFSYLGTRGFAKPGDFNSRILLLVNGHRVNDNIYGGAEIGSEFFIDPAMFERVEIIRGPASSLYGDSAFFGVVNVITRTGDSLGGVLMTLETGTLGTRLARASAGHRLANGLEVALSGTYEHSDGVEHLYFPAYDFPASNHGVAEGLDGGGDGQFYGRLDFKGLTVTGAYGSRQKYVPTASHSTVFNEQVWREETTDRHTLLDGEYRRAFGATHVKLRAAFDQFSFDTTFPLATPRNTLAQVAQSAGLGTRWSASGELTRALPGRQTVTTGLEFIDNLHQDQSTRAVGRPVPVLDSRDSSTQEAVYLQDEIKLAPRLIVNAGLRYDVYQEFAQITPRAALIILPSSSQSVKYLYGRAFRAPNAHETIEFYYGPQVRNLRPESIDTHELVWERYLNDWLRTSASTYWYKADRLITGIAAPTPSGISYINEGEVRAKGLELEAQMRLKGQSRVLISYALQSAIDQDTHASTPNAPRHMVKTRISMSGPTSRSLVSVEGQYLSTRGTLAGATVSGAATVNITMVQPFGRAWELSGSVLNLFDAQYEDPASSANRQDAIAQNGITARLGLHWNLRRR